MFEIDSLAVRFPTSVAAIVLTLLSGCAIWKAPVGTSVEVSPPQTKISTAVGVFYPEDFQNRVIVRSVVGDPWTFDIGAGTMTALDKTVPMMFTNTRTLDSWPTTSTMATDLSGEGIELLDN